FEGRPGGWPHLFQDTTRMRALAEKKETIRYYDVVNFARLVKVAGFYTWGYNDNTVPPTSSWVEYNEIPAPKEKFIVPEAVHAVTPEQRDRTMAWVLAALRR
ncbi:MAG: acetylxylan esterase, partial [Gemmatimonadaceae bacterium]